jgi:hypothetical protein
MSGTDDPSGPIIDPLEQRLRRRLRVAAGITCVGLLAFMAVVATVAPFLGERDLHIDQFVFGTVAGLLCLILGVEIPAWIRRK